MAFGDLKIGYSGASGGFLLLHFILLSHRYNIQFENNKSIRDIIGYQWNIKNAKYWKENEVWPSNSKTLLLPGSRIYFFCNPNKSPVEWNRCNASSLILYTDIESQIILGKYKNAGLLSTPPIKSKQLGTTSYNEDEFRKNTVLIDGCPVTNLMSTCINTANYKVRLQDFVNSNGEHVAQLLNLGPVSQEQKDLISSWKKLHSTEVLLDVGISI